MHAKNVEKNNNLIITILIYEINVVIKKIKKNASKKNIAFHDKYMCMEQKINGNARSKFNCCQEYRN